jgi:hypothetical protein
MCKLQSFPVNATAYHGGALVVHELFIERVAHQNGIHPLLQLLRRDCQYIHMHLQLQYSIAIVAPS